MNRWVTVVGGSNVRDLGGVPLVEGGETAAGVLYRSDTLQEWATHEVRRWRDRGLTLVVDLRAPREVELEGRGPLANDSAVAFVNAPFLPDRAMYRDDLVVHDPAPEQRAAHYLTYLSGEGGRAVVRAVTEIAGTPGAALFHCAAGKDRTGLLAALLLEVAGAEREAVTADYALTDERLSDVVARLSRRETYRAGLAAADPRALRCDPRTMELLLKTLDAEHGGAAGWLSTAGVPGSALSRIRDRLRGTA